MNITQPDSMSFAKKLSYAAPAFALAVVGIPIYVYLPKFYSDVVGVNITVVGVVLLGVRIFDGVTDPLFGWLSDRTRTSFGRRRPYIAGGSILLAVAIVFLFNPPHADSFTVTIWFIAGIFTLFLFWTAVVVPYESLGPEITPDYHERTSLFGLRDGLLIAGTLAAASSPAMIAALFGLAHDEAGERARFFWMSVLYAPLVIALSWWCVAAIKEHPQTRSNTQTGILKGVGSVLANKPFMILLLAYTISAFGSNLPATLILYYVQYVLGSQSADLFLLLYFVTGVLFLPGWIALSRRIGKKETWLAAMVINTGAFLGVFFLGPGDAVLYGILVVFSGIGFGATVAIPSAMQADVIDYDELLSGERREGQYIGLWSIAKKLAAALGIGVALSLVGGAGYIPNVEQTPQVQLTLRVLYSLVPSLCNIAAFAIVFKYPISSRIHEEIREAIRERQAGHQVADPLRSHGS